MRQALFPKCTLHERLESGIKWVRTRDIDSPVLSPPEFLFCSPKVLLLYHVSTRDALLCPYPGVK